ncbi:MAG: hypothetical protein RLZZ623_3294 [Actinomycetota bacterium]|jgi:EmrB/QacA subfamily drug resistance transporter
MEQLEHRQVMRVLVGLMAGMFLAALESTIVATAAPTIVEDLGGLNLLSWVFTAYMLTTTVSAALWGKLSDLMGRRATYLIAVAIFMAGSLLAGLSQTMVQLVVSRGLQGVGGGGLTALGFTVMADILAPRQRGRYIGYISGMFALGAIVGPLLGGVIVDLVGWRAIFLINLPLGATVALIASSALRGVGGRRSAQLDVAGALTLSAAIVCLLLAGVWGGNQYPWGSPQIIGLFLAAVVLFGLFAAIERRAPEPVIALRLLQNRTLVLAMLIGALTTVPFNAAAVYLPLFLQTVHGVGVSSSGLQLAPLMVMMSVGSIAAGRRVSATGRYKRLLQVGLVLAIVDTVWVATLDVGTHRWGVLLMMAVLGLSFGMTAPIVNLIAQNAMPVADLGAASSALITFRSLGATLGVAGVGSVLLSNLRSGIAALPNAAGLDATTIASGPDAIHRLPQPLQSDVIAVMAESVAAGFAICIPLVIVAFFLGVWMPEQPLRDSTAIEMDPVVSSS